MKKRLLWLTLSLSLLLNGYILFLNRDYKAAPYSVTQFIDNDIPYSVLHSDILLNSQMKTEGIEKYLISNKADSSLYNLPLGEYYLLKREISDGQEIYKVVKVKMLEKTQ